MSEDNGSVFRALQKLYGVIYLSLAVVSGPDRLPCQTRVGIADIER